MLLFAIRSALVLGLLYSAFFLFLSRESFHRANRIMLLGIIAVSLMLPVLPHKVDSSFLPFLNPEHAQEREEVTLSHGTASVVVLPSAESAPISRWTVTEVGVCFYAIGVVMFFTLLICKLVFLAQYLRHGLRHMDGQGNTIILKSGKLASFSVLRYIVMSIDDYEHNRVPILLHEQEHIRLGHSYDLMLLAVVQIFQWFNPFVWLLGRDLKAVHEYEADQAVLKKGVDKKSYQYLLLLKSTATAHFSLVNSFSHSQLVGRIIMMNRDASPLGAYVRFASVVPVLLLSFVLTARVAVPSNEYAGTVVNRDTGAPMGGVSIIVEGTYNGTLSDTDGHFMIREGRGKTLVFSFVGYDTKRLELAAADDRIQVQMDTKPTLIELDDLPDIPKTKLPDIPNDGESYFVVVEEQASFPGGVSALRDYINENKQAGAEGQVLVHLTVEKDGTLTNVGISKTADAKLATEALRLVTKMPKWNPARQRGLAVRADYLLPIEFGSNAEKPL